VSVFIVAEGGVNHNGSVSGAIDLVDAAADAGADAVKFQTFRAGALVTASSATAAYQERATGDRSQLEMLERLELDEEAHRAIVARCQDRAIEFMSTPFDVDSLAMLVRLGVRRIKLGSGELTNGPLLAAAAKTGLPLILSTGMATLAETIEATDLVRGAGARDITVLHCTSDYPAPADEVNLRAMATMREALGVPVGYSDHTTGTTVAIAAAALGATMIEKHVTTDRSLPGPDHAASLEPAELADMVTAIRTVEATFGDGVKRPSPAELPNLAVVRRSLIASRSIEAGDPFAEDNLDAKRPGSGISPMRYWDLLGRPARRAYAADELIDPRELEEGTP
jgi:N-acetylneuraminate synthase